MESPEGWGGPYLRLLPRASGLPGPKLRGKLCGWLPSGPAHRDRCSVTARLRTVWGREPTGSGCDPRARRALRPRPQGCPVKREPEISWLRREPALPASFRASVFPGKRPNPGILPWVPGSSGTIGQLQPLAGRTPPAPPALYPPAPGTACSRGTSGSLEPSQQPCKAVPHTVATRYFPLGSVKIKRDVSLLLKAKSP